MQVHSAWWYILSAQLCSSLSSCQLPSECQLVAKPSHGCGLECMVGYKQHGMVATVPEYMPRETELRRRAYDRYERCHNPTSLLTIFLPCL